ncbi:MAG: polysaccharide transporter, family [Actinomycetota bacterium]
MTDVAPDDRHHRRSWLTNAGWLTAANVLSVAISAVVGLALVRAFGAADLGRYSLATVAAVMGGALIGFRLDQHLLTRLNLEPGDERVFALAVRTAFMLYVPAAVVAACVVAVMFGGTARVIGLLAVLEVGLAPMLFLRVVLQVGMRQREALVCTAVSRLFWLAEVAVLIGLDAASVPAVLVARVLSTLVEIAFLVRATGYGPAVVLRNHASLSNQLGELRAAVPLAGSGLAGEFNGRVDQPLLAGLRNSTELGIYAAAVRIADIAGVLAPVAQAVVAPAMVDAARKGDRRAFESVLRDGLIITLVPSAWLVAMTMGQSEWIVRVLVGRQFDSAASLVVILAAAEWVTFIGASYTVALLAVGNRRALAIASIVGLVVNVVGNVVFMPTYGASAAAWMTLIGCAAASLVAMFASSDIRAALPASVPVVLQSAAAVGASAGVVWLLQSNLVASVAAGTATYVALTVGLMRADFFRALKALRRRPVVEETD